MPSDRCVVCGYLRNRPDDRGCTSDYCAYQPAASRVDQALARVDGGEEREVAQVLAEEVRRLRRQEAACSTTIAALMRRFPVSTAHIDSDEIDDCDGKALVVAQRREDGSLSAIDVSWTPAEDDCG